MKTVSNIVSIILFAVALSPVASFAADDASSISQSQARSFNKVLKGTLLQVSDAKIEAKATSGAVGTAGGAGLGAIAGASLGNGGSANLAGSLIGAVAGGIAGNLVGMFAGKQDGQDLIIQVDGGDVINITQANDEKVGRFNEGDSVLIIYKGDSARVIRNKAGQPSAASAPSQNQVPNSVSKAVTNDNAIN